MSIRGGGYSHDEDVLLCQHYLDISQDPITGRQQSRNQFWNRITDAYNQTKNPDWEIRSARSVQNRIQAIEKVVRKLLACIKKVETLKPNGASEMDVLNQANEILMKEYASSKKGFKFDHVWNLLKDFEKFNDHNEARNPYKIPRKNNFTHVSSSSDNTAFESPENSSFSVNLDDDESGLNLNYNVGGSSYERPIGVKKAKQEFLQLEREKLAFKRMAREEKIMNMDLNAISDPAQRAYYQLKKDEILQKRTMEFQGSNPQSSSNMFSQYFSDIGGDGNADIPPY
ncbi:glutathione S-transferase T3-like [Andrographis paniculata]|uniref:glutathione S-transferase T3-like n=1 Tax=Andrographis paniculata TaxID=175694 RepID=UPI0021E97B43|nr:glutathione S-transferase T3-like [Andrographis paniculata]